MRKAPFVAHRGSDYFRNAFMHWADSHGVHYETNASNRSLLVTVNSHRFRYDPVSGNFKSLTDNGRGKGLDNFRGMLNRLKAPAAATAPTTTEVAVEDVVAASEPLTLQVPVPFFTDLYEVSADLKRVQSRLASAAAHGGGTAAISEQLTQVVQRFDKLLDHYIPPKRT